MPAWEHLRRSKGECGYLPEAWISSNPEPVTQPAPEGFISSRIWQTAGRSETVPPDYRHKDRVQVDLKKQEPLSI